MTKNSSFIYDEGHSINKGNFFFLFINIFEALQNGSKSNCAPVLNRGLLSIFLVVEKCKPYEIYKRMFVYGEACSSQKDRQKDCNKWVKDGFATMSASEKDSPWSGITLILYQKKKGHADILVEHKRTNRYRFP